MFKNIFLILSFLGFTERSISQNLFQDVAFEKGILHSYSTGVAGGGVSFCDFNNDGLDDLTIATSSGDSIHFYKNLGGTFLKLNPLISDTFEVKQIIWVDYDNDADKDLYLTTYDGPNRLFQNDGNLILTDVTAAAGLPTEVFESFGACWGDLDRDGFLDLYFTKRAINFENNRAWLYRNIGDGTFENITLSSLTSDPMKAAFQSVFLDINHDLWPDIYTAHDKTQINTLLKNNGDRTFSDISQSSNSDIQINAMCVAIGDYDNDSDLDIYVSNTPDGNKLLNNLGFDLFLEIASTAGVALNGIGWGSNFLDADNDGDLDLYASGSIVGTDNPSSEFFQNEGFGHFTTGGFGFDGDTVSSVGNAVGDFDNDGYPDIFVNNRGEFHSNLWRNNPLGNQNSFLKVKLIGVVSNRDGIGSWITIFSNGQKQVRYTHCGISFLSQNSGTEIFGLKEATEIDSIQVEWLTGHTDKLYDIDVNQTIIIEEGSTTNGDIYVDPEIYNNTSTKYISSKENKISVFPNPTIGSLNIETTKVGIKEVNIFQQGGLKIWSNNYPFFPNKIHENILAPPGIYFIQIIDKSDQIQFFKWIVFD